MQLCHEKIPSPRFFTLETYFLGINDPSHKLLLTNEIIQNFFLVVRCTGYLGSSKSLVIQVYELQIFSLLIDLLPCT